jgi:uncharacterized protein (DUF1778 family)
MKKGYEVKQFNVRLRPDTIELIRRTAVKMDVDMYDVIEEAAQMIARRKKISLEGQAS